MTKTRLRGFELPTGVPKTEKHAKAFILSHATEEERSQYEENPELLGKAVDVLLGRLLKGDVGCRWVHCEKHGLQLTAMKFGADDRCGSCVGEMLAEASKGMVVTPMKRMDLSDLYRMNFDVVDRSTQEEADDEG